MTATPKKIHKIPPGGIVKVASCGTYTNGMLGSKRIGSSVMEETTCLNCLKALGKMDKYWELRRRIVNSQS